MIQAKGRTRRYRSWRLRLSQATSQVPSTRRHAPNPKRSERKRITSSRRPDVQLLATFNRPVVPQSAASAVAISRWPYLGVPRCLMSFGPASTNFLQEIHVPIVPIATTFLIGAVREDLRHLLKHKMRLIRRSMAGGNAEVIYVIAYHCM
ncbi:GL21184 [Drosophila persimilis]|uniref:GL21184 n=1 Tax=Drosophila persimilis TaxID=7234 RepID=B4GXD5_DROPE|nr:GL21184 [Drosophila persimilis]